MKYFIVNLLPNVSYRLSHSRIMKIWYLYTMAYYSAIKRNEILSSAATWMDLESVQLSEISQTEKCKYCIISLIYGI